MKTTWNRKWKIQHTVLEKRTLCFSSCKNRKVKVKLWWVGAREWNKRAFLYRLFNLKKSVLTFMFYLYVKCIEYTFRIYILLHIKKLYFIHFYCLFLKFPKPFTVSLSIKNCDFVTWKYRKISRKTTFKTTPDKWVLPIFLNKNE